MSERDTQFAGFAKLLMQEMIAVRGYIDIGGYLDEDALSSASDYTEIIARRAYDLAYHVVREVLATPHTAEFVLRNELHEVPDLTTLPEVSSE